jgi:hypothetical protein
MAQIPQEKARARLHVRVPGSGMTIEPGHQPEAGA